MSEPMLPASCSLCTVRCFAAPRCIQMTSSSPQDCIAAIQCATTTSGAGPRFLALPAHTRRAEANTPRYRFLPRTQILKGKVKSTSALHTREKSGACFQTLGMQVTLLLAELRCHQGGPQQHLVFSGTCICLLLVLKFTGNLVSQRSQIHPRLSLQKRRDDSNSSAAYDNKNILACLGSIQDSTIPALNLCPYTLPALAGTATSRDRFLQVLLQSVQGSLAGISQPFWSKATWTGPDGRLPSRSITRAAAGSLSTASVQVTATSMFSGLFFRT